MVFHRQQLVRQDYLTEWEMVTSIWRSINCSVVLNQGQEPLHLKHYLQTTNAVKLLSQNQGQQTRFFWQTTDLVNLEYNATFHARVRNDDSYTCVTLHRRRLPC